MRRSSLLFPAAALASTPFLNARRGVGGYAAPASRASDSGQIVARIRPSLPSGWHFCTLEPTSRPHRCLSL